MSSSVLGHQPFYNYFSKPPPKDLGLVRNKKNGVLRIISNNVNDIMISQRRKEIFILVFYNGTFFYQDGRQGMAPIVSNTSERGIDIGLTELRHPQHLNHQHIKHFQVWRSNLICV